jgi:lysozyme
MSTALEAELEAQEGTRAAPYKDSRGLYSIGIGRCLETNPLSGTEWKYLLDHNLITVNLAAEGADWLMQGALDGIARTLAGRLFWFTSLAPARQDALCDMAFQLGTPGLMEFKDMLAAVAAGDWATVYAAGKASAWYTETPARAEQVLVQLRDGVYP